MKKINMVFILAFCFILSSCTNFKPEMFGCRFENDNNDISFITYLDGIRKGGTDTGFIIWIEFEVTSVEGTEIALTIPNEIYIDVYEKEITFYSLGGFTGATVPIKCAVYINVLQELDLDVQYQVTIDFNNSSKSWIDYISVSALNEGFSYKYEFINSKAK